MKPEGTGRGSLLLLACLEANLRNSVKLGKTQSSSANLAQTGKNQIETQQNPLKTWSNLGIPFSTFQNPVKPRAIKVKLHSEKGTVKPILT